MATARKEVELRITANDLGNKSLEELLKTFNDLKTAQDTFAKSGDTSAKSIRELKQDLTDLRAIGQQLASRGALIDLFDKTTQSVEAAAKKVHDAQQALSQFQATQKEGETLTRKQASEYANLQKSLASAEKGFDGAASRAEALQLQLKTIGSSDTAKAKDGLVSFASQVGESLKTSENSIRSYDAALRVKRDGEEAAVKTALKLAEAQREALQMNQAFDAKAGFNKVGQEAIAAANSIDVLTRDFDKLAASGARGGDGLRAIIDPSREAIKTLSGLESEINAVNDKLDKAKTDTGLKSQIKGLRSEYLGLASDAGKAATQIADDIGRYKQQEATVNALRERFVAAREAVLSFGQQIATANGPTDELKRSLTGAQAELAQVAAQVEREGAAFAKLRSSLSSAGVDVKNLSDSETRLRNVAIEVAAAQDKLGAANRKVGQSANDAGKGLSFFEDNGRKSLSVAQRLRGQVLALTASYVGLYGAINLVTKTFEAQQDIKGFEIKLKVANEGDLVATANDIEYVRGQADRLGVSFVDMGNGYANFAIAARGAGVSLKNTRAIFESFTEVSKVMRLSADDTKGVFKALEQVFSKGKVSAEELRGQLGDRLSGAFNEFAKSLGKSAADVNKILTDPNKGIPAEFMLLFAQQYRDKVGKELPEATKTLASEIGRLKSNVADLLNSSANGNLEIALRNLIERVNTFFKSDEGKKFAQGLVDTFVKVFDALRITIDYIGVITTLLKIMTALKVASFFLDMSAGMAAAAVNGGKLTATMTLLSKAIKSLSLLGAAFFIGFEIGTFLNDQFYIVRAAGNNIMGSIDALMRTIPEFVARGWAAIQAIFYTSTADIIRTVVGFVDALGEKFGGAFTALAKIPGLEALGAVAKGLFDAGRKGVLAFADGYDAKGKEAQARVADINKRIAAEIERFKSLQMDMTETIAPPKSAKGPALATEADPTQLAKLREEAAKLGGDSDKTAKKLEALAKSLSDDVSRIIQDLEKSAEGNLEEQLKAANQRFVILQSKLDTLAKAGKSITVGDQSYSIDQVRKLVDEYEVVLEKRITEQFYQKQIAENQKKFTDLVSLSKDAVGTVNDEVQAGIITREQALERLSVIDLKYSAGIKQAGDNATAALRAMPPNIFDKLGAEKLIGDIGKAASGVDALAAKTREDLFKKEIVEGQKKVNDLIDVRRSKVELVNAEVNLGLKTQLQGQEEVRKINVQYSDDILKNAQNLVEMLQALPPDLFAKLGAEKMIADVQRGVLDLKAMRTEAQQLGQQLQRDFGEGFGGVVVTLGQELGKVLQKSQSLGDAFRNVGQAFQQFASDFLIKIATMIVKQQIMNALQAASASGGDGGIWTTLGKAVVGSLHGGGVVGHSGAVSREVNPAWFLNAQRFHDGGMPGLRADEVPAILLKGEEVLNKTDPRNALNGGASSTGGNTRIVNVLDPELARDFMESSAGEKVIINTIKRNPSVLRDIRG